MLARDHQRGLGGYHLHRRRWPEKREAFRTECALEAHRRSLERRLEENEKFDDITLKVAKFAIGKVVAALNDLQQLSLRHLSGSLSPRSMF
jgi:hypothetical protein